MNLTCKTIEVETHSIKTNKWQGLLDTEELDIAV